MIKFASIVLITLLFTHKSFAFTNRALLTLLQNKKQECDTLLYHYDFPDRLLYHFNSTISDSEHYNDSAGRKFNLRSMGNISFSNSADGFGSSVGGFDDNSYLYTESTIILNFFDARLLSYGFTQEFLVKFSNQPTNATQTIFKYMMSGVTALGAEITNGDTLVFTETTPAVGLNETLSVGISKYQDGQFHRVALVTQVRNGLSSAIYIDGVYQNSIPGLNDNSPAWWSDISLVIGNDLGGGHGFKGQIDEFRLTRGNLYPLTPEGFTVVNFPAKEISIDFSKTKNAFNCGPDQLIKGESAFFMRRESWDHASPIKEALTNFSSTSSGTGNYNYAQIDSADLMRSFSNKPFTIEFWMEVNSIPLNSSAGILAITQKLIGENSFGNMRLMLAIQRDSSGDYLLLRESTPVRSDSTRNIAFLGDLLRETFYHIALTRKTDGTVNVYVNGVRKISTKEVTYPFPDDYSIIIGQDGYYSLNGIIDEFRISKREVYDSDFWIQWGAEFYSNPR